MNRFYILGGSGRLGKALVDEFSKEDIITIGRDFYQDWSNLGGEDKVFQYFDNLQNESAIILIASGLLDPTLSREDIFRVNFLLPKNVIQGVKQLKIKVITFGSVMENLMPSKNYYFESKSCLSEYVSNLASDNKDILHIQLHTLYGGGIPAPFMFLGQILSALQRNDVFEMTSGKQLREYHHVLDEVKAIRKLLDINGYGTVNISHGNPITLKNIASSIFDSFGRRELLHIGALPEPEEENFNQTFKLSEFILQSNFRDSLPAIVEYMHQSNNLHNQRG